MADIRPLIDTDRAEWLQLRLKLFPHHEALELDNEIGAILANPDEIGLGAFMNHRMVGFAEVSIRPWGEGCDSAPVAWIEAIYVEPELQRHGIGRALVAAMADWTRERGLSELGSDVEQWNIVSQKSHEAWGFEETMRHVLYRMRVR